LVEVVGDDKVTGNQPEVEEKYFKKRRTIRLVGLGGNPLVGVMRDDAGT
jgi:hypothetical protein